MRRVGISLALVFCAGVLSADVVTTRCQTAESTIYSLAVKTLVACDSSFPNNVLWNIDRIDQASGELDGLAHRTGGAGVVIYIIDSGVLSDHNEFMTPTGSRVIAGYDVLPASANPCTSPDHALQPCGSSPGFVLASSHGTGTASVAAGRYVGVAPDAWIVSIRTVSASRNPGLKEFDDALNAVLQHAFDPRTPPFQTAVVNVSMYVADAPDGSGLEPSSLEFKMRNMTTGANVRGGSDPNGKRFFFSAAVGNAGTGCQAGVPTNIFPARSAKSIDGVVAVGGITSANRIWSGSCGGADVYAPAEEVLVASSTARDHYRGGALFPPSGTSWASPVIAGIAARMLQMNPSLTPAQIEARLLATPSTTEEGAKVPVIIPTSPRARLVRHR